MSRKSNFEEISKLLSEEHQRVYYVYQAFVEGELKYIGKGKGNRAEHCYSGKSSCSELNRDFHAGKNIVVTKYEENLLESEAQIIESNLIQENIGKGIYNKRLDYDMSCKPNIGRMKDVKIIAEDLDKKVIKHLCKLSPEITELSFRKLRSMLDECGLTLYLTEVRGSSPILVIDKPNYTDYDARHIGCPDWPNCTAATCDK